MGKLLKLENYGSRWYATYQDGNFTMTGPTSFHGTMPKDKVISAIQAKNDGTEITEAVYK